jgi:Ca2+-binding RTX toxin-like protein
MAQKALDFLDAPFDRSIDHFDFGSLVSPQSDPILIIVVPDQGGPGDDIVHGLANSNDTVIGNAGNDMLKGFSGDDTLRGGNGNDKAYGDAGNDTAFGEAGNDSLTGGAGNDSLNGGAGNDRITAGDGNDSVAGGAGNDWIKGGNGNDSLNGGTGNDTFYGGAGNDRMKGADGEDTFIYGPSDEGDDRIVGFEVGTDLILINDVNASEFKVDPSGNSAKVTVLSTGTVIILDGLDYRDVADDISQIFVFG